MEKKHYGSIDGLRMIAAFGIVMMHIRANSNYDMSVDYLLMNMWKEINSERSSRY